MSDCPFNGRGMLPRDEAPRPNGDRVCWYCGSWDREQFTAYCRRILAGDILAAYDVPMPGVAKPYRMPRVSPSDRRHKIYVRQEGVRNALEGAIKVYVAHLTQEDIDLANQVIKRCAEAAATRPS
jgi:hypothetical protein